MQITDRWWIFWRIDLLEVLVFRCGIFKNNLNSLLKVLGISLDVSSKEEMVQHERVVREER